MRRIIGVSLVAALVEFGLSRTATGTGRVVCTALGVLCVLVAIFFLVVWVDRRSSQSSVSSVDQIHRGYVQEQEKGVGIMSWLGDFLRGNGDFAGGGTSGDFTLGLSPGTKVRVETYQTVDGHRVLIVKGKFVRVDKLKNGRWDGGTDVTLGQAVAGKRGERVTVGYLEDYVADMTPKGGVTKRRVRVEQAVAEIQRRREKSGMR